MHHLSDERIDAYARRTLAPADLLAADDHLAECADCRARAAARAGAASALDGLLADLRAGDAHLGEADVADHVAGRTGARASAIDAHLRACPTCAREVADLRVWAGDRSRRRALPLAAMAAAVLLAAVLVGLLATRRTAPVPVADGRPAAVLETPAGYASLAPAARQRVRAALAAGVAAVPGDVAALAGETERLMGDAPARSFRLVEPLATAVVDDRPALRWEALPGAEGYVVTVTDESLRPVVRSPRTLETSWTPEAPLERGRVYVWQVAARRGTQTITVPVPPAPLARFKVLDAAPARLLRESERAQPDAHLVLGLLAAGYGARAEAARHLEQVPASDPHRAVAERTLAAVRPPAEDAAHR
jgi:hypothetical protein